MQDITLICMIGAPCSGKSTWIDNNLNKIREAHSANVIIISRDRIREKLFSKGYKQNPEGEKKVTRRFYAELSGALSLDKAVVIIDNCNIHPTYINDILIDVRPMMRTRTLNLYFQIMDCSYGVAFWRNIRRWWKTRKWIPVKVLKDFYRRYEKLKEIPIFDYALNSSYEEAMKNLWKNKSSLETSS